MGDSYLGLMEPYWERHLGCPTHDYTQDARLAALVLLEDVDEIAARVALLDDHVTPMVFLSAGAVDEAIAGPELAGVIVNRLAERRLAIRSDLELYHLDYRPESPPKYPEIAPYDTPMTKDTSVATRPTTSEILAPQKSLASTSRPNSSRPQSDGIANSPKTANRV